MQRINKFPLMVRTGRQIVMMPGTNGRIIHFGTEEIAQGNLLYLWAEVETDLPREENFVWLAFTGDPVPPNYRHAGTVQLGPLVWHLYVGANEL